MPDDLPFLSRRLNQRRILRSSERSDGKSPSENDEANTDLFHNCLLIARFDARTNLSPSPIQALSHTSHGFKKRLPKTNYLAVVSFPRKRESSLSHLFTSALPTWMPASAGMTNCVCMTANPANETHTRKRDMITESVYQSTPIWPGSAPADAPCGRFRRRYSPAAPASRYREISLRSPPAAADLRSRRADGVGSLRAP